MTRKEALGVRSQLWTVFLTFIIWCFRSSSRTEDASVLQSQPERRLMTLTNEGRPHSFVRSNHRLLFVTRPMIGPRTRLCDTQTIWLWTTCVSVFVLTTYYELWIPLSPLLEVSEEIKARELSRYDKFLTPLAISHIWKKPHPFPKEFLIILLFKNMTNRFHSTKKMGQNFHICKWSGPRVLTLPP